ncbi:regulator of G-protein signaling 4-like [Scleropages formosus]|uniref:Regulator of G protein signaling 4 n=1 Tax=Scleropages formosus TaxID=113540 RepID=A0A8C9RRD4_SCLFO|nr:regulator of G-protein signaling 4-like [Scleropages formosus]
MCKGFAALPATCLKSAKDIKHKIGFLLQKPEIQQHPSADNSKEEKATEIQRTDPAEVKKWAESLHNLVSNEGGLSIFKTFLKTEFSQENIEFWMACEEYRRITSKETLTSKAWEIYYTYMDVKSPKEVNLDAVTREDTKRNLKDVGPSSFDEAQKKIFLLMEKDSYRRFIKSNLFLDLLQQPEKRKPSDAKRRGWKNMPNFIYMPQRV